MVAQRVLQAIEKNPILFTRMDIVDNIQLSYSQQRNKQLHTTTNSKRMIKKYYCFTLTQNKDRHIASCSVVQNEYGKMNIRMTKRKRKERSTFMNQYFIIFKIDL